MGEQAIIQEMQGPYSPVSIKAKCILIRLVTLYSY